MRKNRRFLAIIMVLAFLGWSFNAQRVFADSEIPPEIQQEEQEVVDEEQNEEQPENNLEPENEEEVIEDIEKRLKNSFKKNGNYTRCCKCC